MSTIDLDNPPDEARPYAELYEATKIELDSYRRALESIQSRFATAMPGCPNGMPLAVYASNLHGDNLEMAAAIDGHRDNAIKHFNRCNDLAASLEAVVGIIERIGGYLKPEDLDILTDARECLIGVTT